MGGIVYRKIDSSDKVQVFDLIKVCMDNLERKEFFIPFSEEELGELLGESDGTRLGAFNGEELIGMISLDAGGQCLQDVKENLGGGVLSKKICEFGSYLVLPDYRGRGIMSALQSMLMDIARDLGYEIVVATVHPENIASIRTLQKVFTYQKTFVTSGGYLRQIMLTNL